MELRCYANGVALDKRSPFTLRHDTCSWKTGSSPRSIPWRRWISCTLCCPNTESSNVYFESSVYVLDRGNRWNWTTVEEDCGILQCCPEKAVFQRSMFLQPEPYILAFLTSALWAVTCVTVNVGLLMSKICIENRWLLRNEEEEEI